MKLHEEKKKIEFHSWMKKLRRELLKRKAVLQQWEEAGVIGYDEADDKNYLMLGVLRNLGYNDIENFRTYLYDYMDTFPDDIEQGLKNHRAHADAYDSISQQLHDSWCALADELEEYNADLGWYRVAFENSD